MITTREAARRLQVQTQDIKQMADAKLITRHQMVEPNQDGRGGVVLFDEAEIDALAATPEVESHPAAFVVRVKPAVSDMPYRPFMGFSTNYGTADDEVTRQDALRQWWPAANPDSLKDQALVALLSGFVVAVYRITGYERQPGPAGKVSFTVTDPTDEQVKCFMHKRWKLTGGPVALPVSADENSDDTQIVDAIRRFEAEVGPADATLSNYLKWRETNGGPSLFIIRKTYGDWSKARKAATGGQGKQNWTDDDLKDAIKSYLASTDKPTSRGFDRWAIAQNEARPRVMTLITRFGMNWNEIISAALSGTL